MCIPIPELLLGISTTSKLDSVDILMSLALQLTWFGSLLMGLTSYIGCFRSSDNDLLPENSNLAMISRVFPLVLGCDVISSTQVVQPCEYCVY